MRNLINRLKREKVSIERSLIDKTRTGIPVNEIRDNERRLNRIEAILRGIRGNMSRYATVARIDYLNRTRDRQEATM